MLFFNANFICYYFYPTKKREEPFYCYNDKVFIGEGHAGRYKIDLSTIR